MSTGTVSTSTVSTGLRETKRAALARQLAAVAFDLVRRHGVAEVTVEDIVAVAQVSRRTFSNYYPCKEAAVAAVVGHRVGAALASWRPPATDDVLTLIGDLVDHQVAQGALEALGEVAALARRHPQLVPYVREAQWQVWSAVGDRVLQAVRDPLPSDVEGVHLAVGALFGLVGAGLAGGPGPGPSAATVHAGVVRALERLRDGLAADPPPLPES